MLEKQLKVQAPICATCGVPRAKWEPEYLVYLCHRCAANSALRAMLGRPKNPNAVC